VLDTALAVVKNLQGSDFLEEHTSHVHPYISYTDLDSDFVKFDLPLILVPPEVIELDSLATESGEDSQVKKDEWPEFQIRLFENDVSSFNFRLLLKSNEFCCRLHQTRLHLLDTLSVVHCDPSLISLKSTEKSVLVCFWNTPSGWMLAHSSHAREQTQMSSLFLIDFGNSRAPSLR
jgi:hypothetical protein